MKKKELLIIFLSALGRRMVGSRKMKIKMQNEKLKVKPALVLCLSLFLLLGKSVIFAVEPLTPMDKVRLRRCIESGGKVVYFYMEGEPMLPYEDPYKCDCPGKGIIKIDDWWRGCEVSQGEPLTENDEPRRYYSNYFLHFLRRILLSKTTVLVGTSIILLLMFFLRVKRGKKV